jgi:hypothetical protein
MLRERNHESLPKDILSNSTNFLGAMDKSCCLDNLISMFYRKNYLMSGAI